MDHLALPSQASKPPLNVPIVSLSRYSYGHHEFATFPAEHLTEIYFENPGLSNDEALLSVAQTWLYFGTLSEFLQRNFDPGLFKRIDQHEKPVLISKIFSSLKDDWVQSKLFIDASSREKVSRRCIALLVKALYALENFEEHYSYLPSMMSVLIATRILLCSLAITTQVVTESRSASCPLVILLSRLRLQTRAMGGHVSSGFVLRDHMMNNGWCPHQIHSLLQEHCATTMIYFACMFRHKPHVSHRPCIESASCVAHAGLTPLRHTSQDCSCESMGVDESLLLDYIKRDAITLVSCTRSPGGKLQLKLVEATNSSKYTAISHVWIDGLGNPHDNAMPECQLERLVSRIQLLRPPELSRDATVLFWMDTFCIPVAHREESPEMDQERAKLKRRAIGLMTPIYFGAEHVLVLDSELDKLAHDEITFTELTARLKVCGWMGRAWTLQEGSLASKLCFQFGNGALFAYEGQRSFGRALTISSWNKRSDEQTQIMLECRNAWYLPSIAQHEPDQSNGLTIRDVQFLEVWNSLTDRSTSMADDYHEIVANLLDFNALEMHSLPSEHAKMQSMLFHQDRLPIELLCLPNNDVTPDHGHGEPSRLDFWVPNRPSGVKLSRNSLTKVLYHYNDDTSSNAFSVSSAGPPWYTIKSRPQTLKTFCLVSPTNNQFHPCITLEKDYTVPADSLGLCIFLATTPGHPLLLDTKHYGACFITSNISRRSGSHSVIYYCSLTFTTCWKDHESNETYTCICIPENGSKVCILRGSSYRPRMRRPPNAAKWGYHNRATIKKRVLSLWGPFVWVIVIVIAYFLFIPFYLLMAIISIGSIPFGILILKGLFARRFWRQSYATYNFVFTVYFNLLVNIISVWENAKWAAQHLIVWKRVAEFLPKDFLRAWQNYVLQRGMDRWNRDERTIIEGKEWQARGGAEIDSAEYCYFRNQDIAGVVAEEDSEDTDRLTEIIREQDKSILRTMMRALSRTPD